MQLRIAEQYVAQFGKLAKAGNTFVVPANLSDIGEHDRARDGHAPPRRRPGRRRPGCEGLTSLASGMELDPARLEALCLDLDDTILDSEGSVRAAWELVADGLVAAHPGMQRAAVLAAIEGATRWFWEDDERHRRGRLDLDWARQEVVGRTLETLERPRDAALVEDLGRAYTALRERELWLFDGAIELLERFRARFPRMALVTNGAAATQRAKIERFDLARYFDHLQVEGEFGAGKPDAAVYRHVLERLGVAPAAALMAGDNYHCDVLGPLAVGMHAAWIEPSGQAPPPAPAPRAHWTLRTLRELAARLGV